MDRTISPSFLFFIGRVVNGQVHVQEGKRSYLITPLDLPNRPSKSDKVQISNSKLPDL